MFWRKSEALQQIANENADVFPMASKAIKENFYVDDYLDGRNNESAIIQLQSTVNELLRKSGCMHRQIQSNII